MLGDWHDNGGQLVWREKAKDNLSGSPPKQKSAGAGWVDASINDVQP